MPHHARGPEALEKEAFSKPIAIVWTGLTPANTLPPCTLILAEQFDNDPLLLFALRGRSREQMQALLTEADEQDETQATPEPAPNIALSADPTSFWHFEPLTLPDLAPPTLPAPVAGAGALCGADDTLVSEQVHHQDETGNRD